MSSIARFGWFCLLCAFAAMFPLGCTPNLEKNEQFSQEKARLDRVDEDQKATRLEIIKMNGEFNRIATEIAALKRGGPAGAPAASGDALSALTLRLNALEAQMRTLAAGTRLQSGAQAAAQKTTEAAPGRPLTAPAGASRVAAPAVAGKPAPAPKGQVAVTVKGARSRATLTPRGGVTATKPAAPRKPAPAEAASAGPAGFYHQVTASDTIASIAGKYGISPAAIVKENSLSASNPRIFIGNSLYIPKQGGK